MASDQGTVRYYMCRIGSWLEVVKIETVEKT